MTAPDARILALHGRPLTLSDTCTPTGGLNARDQRVGHWQQSVKRHERLSARESVKTNVRTQVGITGGYVSGASAKKDKPKPSYCAKRTPAKKPGWAR